MNILIIGGTVFLGRHLVAACRDAGHTITLFNRGNQQLEEHSDLEKIKGDRTSDLTLLSGRKWDAVIDTCGIDPETVQQSAQALSASTKCYVYISSISAFDNFRRGGMTEAAPARLIPKSEAQDYGSNKAWSEKAVGEVFGRQALIIRPGLIVGRYDPSDRFTYWVRRIAQGGRILAPGRQDRQIQFIDVRDLSEWIIRLIDARITGTFNVTGPGFPLSMQEFLHTTREVCKSNSEFNFVDDEKLVALDVKPWSELPLWIPESDSDFFGFLQIDCLRAQNTGLSYRTIAETVEDTLAWDQTRDKTVPLKAGLAPDRERELLSALIAPH